MPISSILLLPTAGDSGGVPCGLDATDCHSSARCISSPSTSSFKASSRISTARSCSCSVVDRRRERVSISRAWSMRGWEGEEEEEEVEGDGVDMERTGREVGWSTRVAMAAATAFGRQRIVERERQRRWK